MMKSSAVKSIELYFQGASASLESTAVTFVGKPNAAQLQRASSWEALSS